MASLCVTDESYLDASGNEPVINSENLHGQRAPAPERSRERSPDIGEPLQRFQALDDRRPQWLVHETKIFAGLRQQEELAGPRHDV